VVELGCEDGTGSGSCSVATFGIGGVEASGFVTRDVVSRTSLSDEVSQITQGKERRFYNFDNEQRTRNLYSISCGMK
jgi:hypothetical protein